MQTNVEKSFTNEILHPEVSVLLIDADKKNASCVERMLSVAQGAMEVHGGAFSVTRVENMAAALAILRIEVFGAVLLNLQLPDCKGMACLERIHRLVGTLPVIVLTDIDNEAMALAAIKAGAQDWLPTRDLGRDLLTRTIRHAIERKRAEAKLLEHTREVEASRCRIEQQAEEIKAHAEKLDKINRELQDFAYIASHDLKEPLRGIASYCQVFWEDYHDSIDTEGHRRLKVIDSLCQRLERLIDNLLTYCRVGRVSDSETQVDLNKIVAEQIEIYRANTHYANARIVFRDVLPMVKGDESLIGMVVANLLSNALKYNSHKRPKIEIGVVATDQRGNSTQGGDQCVFYIKDNGIGIEEKYHEDVFSLFRRLHPRHKFEGTGAGLTIARKIVESHGGRIWVESQPGGGSTFYFSLPLGCRKSPSSARVKSSPHFSRSSEVRQAR